MSEYYSNNASGYTAGVSGVPATGSPFPFSSMYGKQSLYTLQHPDGRAVLRDTSGAVGSGYKLCFNASATTVPFKFAIYNNANVYLNANAFVGILYDPALLQAVYYQNAVDVGGFLVANGSFQNNNTQYAFRFRPEILTGGARTGRYFIDMIGTTNVLYIGYDSTNDALRAVLNTDSRKTAWIVTPAPSPEGPVTIG
jgi:hypothetical protein